MKTLIKKILRMLGIPFILKDYFHFKKNLQKRFQLSLADAYPQLYDKTITTSFDRHYIYHTAWAARVLAEQQPLKHIDVSSSLYFSAITSAFIPVDFYDFRKADLELENLTSSEGDLMSLPFAENSVESLSCMHTVEHIGLGRYGDPIDIDGDVKAAKELARVLAAQGSLLFVVPMGKKSKIEFNAHRIYDYQTALNLFPTLTLKEFAFIPEHCGSLIRNADPKLLDNESYACGCFHFTKK